MRLTELEMRLSPARSLAPRSPYGDPAGKSFVHPSSRCGVRSWLGPHRRSEELYSCSSFVPRPGNSLLYPRPVSIWSFPCGGRVTRREASARARDG